ncbi:MAG: N-acetylmuramoyl-L-alanine amidase [Firmicutes bacterium]|nr:N-acetylmuramoyl-L-alanine amidase [Bacillota bacterium]
MKSGLVLVGIAVLILSHLFITETIAIGRPVPQYTVVIDAGHGGIDGGSVGRTTGVKESDLNLSISRKLETHLKSMGVGVIQTRKTEDGLYGTFAAGFKRKDMSERKRIIQNSGADLVVSIHMNILHNPNVQGAQVFYSPDSETSRALAADIQQLFIKNLPHTRPIPKPRNFYILDCSNIPTVLIECGFLSNPEEERLLQTADYQNKLAYQMFLGIMHFFNLTTEEL